ncbi:hypothetical protein FHR92_003937 [Fontibacillus solani]|uniref:Uncharacterized protein n=1 Tax=Fontibacillus solani TaxID=1572857 RepID=A0A7W3XT70_9BACL|nr:hypothetical protein [Fontibacillus solani]
MIFTRFSLWLQYLSKRLSSIVLTLESVVKFKKRFDRKYSVRKSIQTEFAGDGILFQTDAIAYKKGHINE